MIDKNEFETMINSIRDKMDDTTRGKISDELLNVVSNYNNAIDEIESLNEENKKLTSDKDELLKVNGKLFQRIGFDKEENEEKEIFGKSKKEEKEEKISITDIINERGELI